MQCAVWSFVAEAKVKCCLGSLQRFAAAQCYSGVNLKTERRSKKNNQMRLIKLVFLVYHVHMQ